MKYHMKKVFNFIISCIFHWGAFKKCGNPSNEEMILKLGVDTPLRAMLEHRKLEYKAMLS